MHVLVPVPATSPECVPGNVVAKIDHVLIAFARRVMSGVNGGPAPRVAIRHQIFT